MKYKWTAQIEIADIWVKDGFDLTKERLKDMVMNSLPFAQDFYADGSEVKVKILSAPSKASIRKEQGY